MDFETTGLIPSRPNDTRPIPGDTNRNIQDFFKKCILFDVPSEMPQITELCVLSLPREHFDRASNYLLNCSTLEDDNHELLVHVATNFYSCQIRPSLYPNQWKEYEEQRLITPAIHLSQEDLKYKSFFKDEWPLVHMFLQKQRRPACIIAHNGVRFDFRVLYSELTKNKLLEEYPIPDDVYFLDSYMAFLDLEKNHLDTLSATTTTVDWSKIGQVVQHVKKIEYLSKTIDDEAGTSKETTINDSWEENCVGETLDPLRMPKKLDGLKTPPKKRKYDEISTKFEVEIDESILPLSFMNTSQWSPAKKRRTSKKFFRKSSEKKWEFNDSEARDYFFKGNFKLETLYKNITKSDYNAHYAYDDCQALMQVCLAYGKDFADYMDAKREKLADFHGKK
uniref:Exonuclease domain-containing protein n=1 Tax=Panagrolaimus sp. JU765 TaxID=591449 RepID=A0AC34QX85_9BILA